MIKRLELATYVMFDSKFYLGNKLFKNENDIQSSTFPRVDRLPKILFRILYYMNDTFKVKVNKIFSC